MDKFFNPSDCHQTPLSIRKLLMIANQMFLIPGVLFDIFVVFNTVECHLAEAVVICNISPVLVFRTTLLVTFFFFFFSFLFKKKRRR